MDCTYNFLGIFGLRNVHIIVPSAVIKGRNVTLSCFYDMEGEQLYSVKWYLNTLEFFRYVPRVWPRTYHFSVYNGQRLKEVASNSNFTSLVIINVPRNASGRYSCEVSGDAPSFPTSISQSKLQVCI